jgi:hypothetical protein
MKKCGKTLSGVQWGPNRPIRTETRLSNLANAPINEINTTPNHLDSYKLVFKIQRWLNCRTGTKHGSFTNIPTQAVSSLQRLRYWATDPARTLQAETQFSGSADICKCAWYTVHTVQWRHIHSASVSTPKVHTVLISLPLKTSGFGRNESYVYSMILPNVHTIDVRKWITRISLT